MVHPLDIPESYQKNMVSEAIEDSNKITEYKKYLSEVKSNNGIMYTCYLCHADSFERNKMFKHIETDHFKMVLCKNCNKEVRLIDMETHMANNHDKEAHENPTNKANENSSNKALINHTKTGKGYTRIMDRNNGRYTVVLYKCDKCGETYDYRV